MKNGKQAATGKLGLCAAVLNLFIQWLTQQLLHDVAALVKRDQ